MPIQSRKTKAKRAVFTVDMSATGQGPEPYPAKYGITMSPPSGSSFPSSSHVAITATPLGAYTAPATYTWYLEGVQQSVTGSTSNTYDFGDLNGPRTASVAVDVITAGGTVTKTAVYDVTADELTLEIFDSGTGAGTFTGDGTYEIGHTAAIEAIPDESSSFSHWVVNSGNEPVATGSAATLITLTLNTSLDAVFNLN